MALPAGSLHTPPVDRYQSSELGARPAAGVTCTRSQVCACAICGELKLASSHDRALRARKRPDVRRCSDSHNTRTCALLVVPCTAQALGVSWVNMCVLCKVGLLRFSRRTLGRSRLKPDTRGVKLWNICFVGLYGSTIHLLTI